MDDVFRPEPTGKSRPGSLLVRDTRRGIDAVESLRRDAKRRQKMAARGRALFDGLGRRRVLEATETVRDGKREGEASA